MVEVGSLVASLISYGLSGVLAGLRVVLSVSLWMSHDYPAVFNALLAVAGSIFLYKLGRRVINVWLSFLVIAFKFFIVNVAVVSAVILWLRGPDQVLNSDIPAVVNFCHTFNPSRVATMAKGAHLFANSVHRDAGDSDDDNAVKFDDYLGSFSNRLDEDGKISYEEAEDLVAQGIEYFQNSNIDWTQVGANLLGLINQGNEAGRR
ncbi:hypothetical protein DICA3_E10616 [Diutina catenulata]